MSISLTNAQRSKLSSSQTLYQNPNYDHNGALQASQLVGSPISDSALTHSFESSLQISPSQYTSNRSSGSMSSVASADTGGPSKKVSETRNSYGRRSSYRQDNGKYMQRQSAGQGQGGMSSQFRYDQAGSGQPTGELSRIVSSQQQPISGSVGLGGSAATSTVRKNQMMSANHLLNFHYDRGSRPQPRIPPPPRRQQKTKPYNKDLFLQANYKFVVLDSGNYEVESNDPDKMLQWENVVCVRHSTPFPVQCPICLENPLCPQITTCGHIFCFPCILRYLLLGEEDNKGDCWKKCPLCFMMISVKDLYTIYIENVRHCHVGDTVQFTLLTRQKNSLFPSQKNQHAVDSMVGSSADLCDSFSRFILTSDVELSVREAYSELKGWLARADSGFVDDLEQLPYVCAALEQLEKRKRCWAEIHSLSCSPPVRDPQTPYSHVKGCKYSSKTESQVLSCDVVDSEVYKPTSAMRPVGHKDEPIWSGTSTPKKLDVQEDMTVSGDADLPETCDEGEKVLSSSYDEEKTIQRVSNGPEHIKDSYSFYQAVDGQNLILHPLNMKCLLHYYGSYDLLPPRITGQILQLETVTQSDAMRRRYRYLSHFSLKTTFQLCEIDMSKILGPDALAPFNDEIKKRESQRKRIAKKEHQEKVKAEVEAAAAQASLGMPSNYVENTFSMDDFEALGNSPVSSTSPPPVSGERKLFSDVARLGFAAAHDSPSLKVDESCDVSTQERGETSGKRNMVTLSFANILSTENSSEAPKMNGIAGKKGKKPSRVLMSTAGVRRY